MHKERLLRFGYRMELVFSEPVRHHQFTLRMIPQSDGRQTISDCSVMIDPDCALSEGEDAFGNKYVYGEVWHEHQKFKVEVGGTARVAKVALPCDKPLIMLAPYRFASQYTRPGNRIREYFEKNGPREGEGTLAFCGRLVHQIYGDMEYVQGVTDIHTTAEEALAGRKGVCQDYAHIMIALCRLAGIPSRYVVGMMMGEGYSHAWVEVCADGGWHGMDPTNDRAVDDTYVKLSHGRDYQDCIVNRGTFSGNGTQKQIVNVTVTEERLEKNVK